MFAAWAVGVGASSLNGQQPPPMEYWEAVDAPPRDALLGRWCESTSYYHAMYVQFRNSAPVMTVLVFDLEIAEKQVFTCTRSDGQSRNCGLQSCRRAACPE